MFQNKLMNYAMPLAFALLWASTYASVKIGLDFISPILFVAIRLSAAAAMMLCFVFVIKRKPIPGRIALFHLLIAGALINGVTLVTAHVALVSVQVAPLALVHAIHPMATAAFAVPLLREVFSARQWGGIAMGVLGVVLVFPFATTDWSVIVLVSFSLAGLTGGTLYLKFFAPDIAAFPSTAIQVAGGAITAVICTLMFETPYVNWTPALTLSMVWNIFMVSIFAMWIYSVMVTRGQAGRAASAFFIVPGVTALSAWIMLDQSMTPLALLGLFIASFGVWLVWWRAD